MPRDVGTGIYFYPSGTKGNPGQTIFSTRYNTFLDDLTNTLNQALPVNMGGTGGISAVTARDNLDAEVSMQLVTNYDAHLFEAGSFYSNSGATAAPNPTGFFHGICIGTGTTITLLAYDFSDGLTPHTLYTRSKNANVWGTWTLSPYVARAGDTMTGDLQIKGLAPHASLVLNKTNAGGVNQIAGQLNGVTQWGMRIGDTAAGNFTLYRHNDAGTQLDSPLAISRATGMTAIRGLQAGITLPSVAYGGAVIGMGYSGFGITFKPTIDATSALIFTNAADTLVGQIFVQATTTSYMTTSDGRLKEDLKSFDAGNIVDDTMVYDFAWKTTGERSYGIIAQQANEVYPTAVVHMEEQDTWGIDYSKYVPVIMQELKALRARVAELEGRLEGKPA